MALRELGWATVALGLLALGSGLIHQVAVTVLAFRERGGYDLRLGTLLAIGFGVMLAGSLLVIAGLRFVRGAPDGMLLAALGAGTMLLMSAALSTVAEGFWIGIVLYGGYLVALIVFGR